jgi:hypothetical protein
MLDTLQHHLIWGAVSPAYSSLVAAADCDRARSGAAPVPVPNVDSSADASAAPADSADGPDSIGLRGEASGARCFRPSFQASVVQLSTP